MNCARSPKSRSGRCSKSVVATRQIDLSKLTEGDVDYDHESNERLCPGSAVQFVVLLRRSMNRELVISTGIVNLLDSFCTSAL